LGVDGEFKDHVTHKGHVYLDLERVAAEALLIGKSVPILDIGGNAERHLLHNRSNVKSLVSCFCSDDRVRAERWARLGANFEVKSLRAEERWYERAIGIHSAYYFTPADFVYAIILGGGNFYSAELDYPSNQDRGVFINPENQKEMEWERIYSPDSGWVIKSFAEKNSATYIHSENSFQQYSVISVSYMGADFFVKRTLMKSLGSFKIYSYSLYARRTQENDVPPVGFSAKSWDNWLLTDSNIMKMYESKKYGQALIEEEEVSITVPKPEIIATGKTIVRSEVTVTIPLSVYLRLMEIIICCVNKGISSASKLYYEEVLSSLEDENIRSALRTFFEIAVQESSAISIMLNKLSDCKLAKKRLKMQDEVSAGVVTFEDNRHKLRKFFKSLLKFSCVFSREWKRLCILGHPLVFTLQSTFENLPLLVYSIVIQVYFTLMVNHQRFNHLLGEVINNITTFSDDVLDLKARQLTRAFINLLVCFVRLIFINWLETCVILGTIVLLLVLNKLFQVVRERAKRWVLLPTTTPFTSVPVTYKIKPMEDTFLEKIGRFWVSLFGFFIYTERPLKEVKTSVFKDPTVIRAHKNATANVSEVRG